MRKLPHLLYLEAFEAAARHLSFTRAAEELNCTQAAISQRVRALEQFFSRPLFHRRNNGLALTEAGLAYLPGVTEALDRAEVATTGLLGAQAKSSVTISAPVTFVALWLAPNLASFALAHPQVELRINSTIWTDPNVELADLSILALDAEPNTLGSVRLSEERVVLLCDHETAERARGTPVQRWLNDSRLIYVQGRMQLLDRWARGRKLDIAPKLAPIKADNAAAALEIASSTGGIVTTLSTYAAPYLTAGRLVAPFGMGEPLPIALYLVPNQQRRLSRSATAFVEWLRKQFPLAGQL